MLNLYYIMVSTGVFLLNLIERKNLLSNPTIVQGGFY